MNNNDMGGVNRNIRRRAYEARDKEELIQAIIKLYNESIGQVDISKLNRKYEKFKIFFDDIV